MTVSKSQRAKQSIMKEKMVFHHYQRQRKLAHLHTCDANQHLSNFSMIVITVRMMAKNGYCAVAGFAYFRFGVGNEKLFFAN